MFFLAVGGVRVNGPKRNRKNQLERKTEGLSSLAFDGKLMEASKS